MRVLILSHTEYSRTVRHGGMGEIIEAQKMSKVIEHVGHGVENILDLYALLEPLDTHFYPLGRLNMSLAEANFPLLLKTELPLARTVQDKILSHTPEVLLFLSYDFPLAAFLASGGAEGIPLVSKLYQFQEWEPLYPSLYESSHLLIAESLLASIKGCEAGIPPEKMIYLPHSFPEKIDEIGKLETYLGELAHLNGKPLPGGNDRVVVGIVSRLRREKNCLEAFEAIARLVQEGAPVMLIVKGFFEGEQLEIAEEMQSYLHEPWFFWDPKPTKYPEVLGVYKSFDILLNISGREGANILTTECMALGIPSVVLDGTTNPYLFRGGALFVKREEDTPDFCSRYQKPDKQHLYETLKELIYDSDLRQKWGVQAKEVARQRFAPAILQKRVHLLFEHLRGTQKKEVFLKLFENDRKVFGIE